MSPAQIAGRTGYSIRETRSVSWMLTVSGCDYVRPLKSSADGHIVKVLEGRFALHVAQIWYYARDALVFYWLQ